ncbi:MAG: S8 family serine peptidase [Isosphaeraceae bacterium]
MQHVNSKIDPKLSLSLSSLIASSSRKLPEPAAARSLAFLGASRLSVSKADLVSVLIETDDADKLLAEVPTPRAEETVEKLSDGILSAHLGLGSVQKLAKLSRVDRVQSKKRKQPHLTSARADISLTASVSGPRQVAETGKDVLIGIIDSGFDLTHPMLLDSSGKPRVEGLLVQHDDGTQKEFTAAEVAAALAAGSNPAADENGHGTHVASIAGGTSFKGFEGIAPDARFLLVKTDFLNTDRAAAWVFRKAKNRPCVINMSLGHHFGAHDGTDAEERLHETLIGPGKLIVISAGNERTDAIHIGGRFFPTQAETVSFDILPDRVNGPSATMTLWYDQRDEFDIELVSPSGTVFKVPAVGTQSQFPSSAMVVSLLRQRYAPSALVQAQLQIRFTTLNVSNLRLRGWSLRLTCNTAVVGRIDGWFSNSGFATFRPHALVETARTVGLSATGRGCLAVASHVSKNAWKSDLGDESDIRAVVGRSSSFSSLGPTRDGRRKPDISAPGQFVTAALATGSDMAGLDERVVTADRLLTIEGTSMASPVVTGVVALMLQKKPKLKLADALTALSASARRDAHTGVADWTPTYGVGKIDVKAALDKI